MDRCERRILRVISVGATDHVLEKEKIPRTSLHYCEQPIPEFEFPTARIGFLRRDEVGECAVVSEQGSIGSEGI